MELFGFQVEDGQTIAKRRSALVAHQPRVGKTGIGIHAADLLRARLVVVVCPAAVKDNWRKAIEIFRKGRWLAVIVSYNKAGEVLKVLRGKKIDVLIVDESHYLKERSSNRSRVVFGPGCDGAGGLVELASHVYCLTGTPMPNSPIELWPMLRALAPELIDNGRGKPMSWSTFRDRYCKQLQTPYGMKIVGGKNYKELKDKMKGFVLRRTRAEVFGRDLVPPTTVYVRAEAGMKNELAALSNSAAGLLVKQALESSNPLKALAKAEKQAASLRKLFGMAKVPGLIRLIGEELDMEPGEKLVIFAYHHAVIDALRMGLRKYGAVSFDGRVSPDRKISIQNKFQNDSSTRIVIGQIQAMGVGLDFSRANNTLFAEQDWVGDNNEQARARMFNAGSPEPKFTRFAVLVGSMDEQIAAACARKMSDSDKILGP